MAYNSKYTGAQVEEILDGAIDGVFAESATGMADEPEYAQAVLTEPQSLTDEQKAQVRENIGVEDIDPVKYDKMSVIRRFVEIIGVLAARFGGGLYLYKYDGYMYHEPQNKIGARVWGGYDKERDRFVYKQLCKVNGAGNAESWASNHYREFGYDDLTLDEARNMVIKSNIVGQGYGYGALKNFGSRINFGILNYGNWNSNFGNGWCIYEVKQQGNLETIVVNDCGNYIGTKFANLLTNNKCAKYIVGYFNQLEILASENNNTLEYVLGTVTTNSDISGAHNLSHDCIYDILCYKNNAGCTIKLSENVYNKIMAVEGYEDWSDLQAVNQSKANPITFTK